MSTAVYRGRWQGYDWARRPWVPTATGAATVVLDTGTIAVAGADLPAAVSVLLDTGSVAVAGVDLLTTASVALDTGALTVAGVDLSAAVLVTLDTGAMAVAGVDLGAAVVSILDTGAIAVAGVDITPLAAGDVVLDTGAIAVAGVDLSAAATVVLDTDAIAVAGNDITIVQFGIPSLLANSAAGGATDTTDPFTPTASSRLFCRTVSRLNVGSDAPVAVVTDSESGTWTELTGGAGLITAATSYRQQLWTRVASASPASMTVTMTATGATTVALDVEQISGASSDFSNIKVATNANGDPSVVLDATPSSSSAVLCWFGAREISGSASGTPANYTQLFTDLITSIRYTTARFTGTPPASTTISWSSTCTLAIATALEIKLVSDPVASLISIAATAATADTAAWTPNANALLLAFAGATIAAGTPVKPTVSDTQSLVWTEIGDVDSGTVRETLYWAKAEASPASRTATVASAGASSVVLKIVEAPGLQIRSISTVPNVGTGSNAAGDPSAWLDAPANSGGVIVGGAFFLGVNGVAPGDGYTELEETAAGSVSLLQTQFAEVV